MEFGHKEAVGRFVGVMGHREGERFMLAKEIVKRLDGLLAFALKGFAWQSQIYLFSQHAGERLRFSGLESTGDTGDVGCLKREASAKQDTHE